VTARIPEFGQLRAFRTRLRRHAHAHDGVALIAFEDLPFGVRFRWNEEVTIVCTDRQRTQDFIHTIEQSA
jgi:hypothetical protein